MRLTYGGLGSAAALLLAAIQVPDQGAALAALQRQDASVATAGFRLARANLALCANRSFLAGITPHYLSQYDAAYRKAAARQFQLDTRPSVLAVAAGSPAEQAGLRAGDRLVAIDGQPFATAQAKADSGVFTDTEQALDLIDRVGADGALALRIERGHVASDVSVRLAQGCGSRFQVVPGDNLKAQADGAYVQISAGSVAFAQNDGELASVLAHELAHNMLRHRVTLERQGALKQGLFGPGARNARLIRATEIEADRLSPYLMANAGYDPRDAIRYWMRHGAQRGDRWFRTGTHPRWRERVRLIETEVARIEAARAKGEDTRIPADLAAIIAQD
jgi:hypothetical protein